MCFPPFGALLTPFNYKDRKLEKVQPTFSKFAKNFCMGRLLSREDRIFLSCHYSKPLGNSLAGQQAGESKDQN